MSAFRLEERKDAVGCARRHYSKGGASVDSRKDNPSVLGLWELPCRSLNKKISCFGKELLECCGLKSLCITFNRDSSIEISGLALN